MLKSYGWGGGGVVVVAHKILVSAQGPLVLGLRVWGQGLTIKLKYFGTASFSLVNSMFLSPIISSLAQGTTTTTTTRPPSTTTLPPVTTTPIPVYSK